MKKKDDIKEYYDTCVMINKILSFLFYISAFLSISVEICPFYADNYFFIIQTIIIIIYCLLGILNEYCFFYKAEKLRRINAIENGFDIKLNDKKTEAYYTTQHKKSFKKYALNIFQSCFFTKNISEKMQFQYIIKTISAIIIFIVLFKSSNMKICPTIAGIIFSASIIGQSARFFLFYNKIEKSYKSMYSKLVTNLKISFNTYIELLEEIMEYENIKSYFRIQLSENIYKKYKEELEIKFQEILKNIK